jgi:ferredoxin-NADP reductase
LHDFYVCGSPPMVRSSLRTLAGMGVPSIRVNYDAFADLPEVAADQRR